MVGPEYPEHLSAIEASLAIAAERGGDIAPPVYARLFQDHPDVEPLFCLDTDGAIRGSMLTHALEVILDSVGERSYAPSFNTAAAVTHFTDHDLQAPVFVAFYAAIRDTVRALSGPDWTDAMQAAWQAALADLRAGLGLA